MPSLPLNVLLEQDLTPKTSAVFPYPKGTGLGSFAGAANHTLGVEGSFFRSPRDFIVTPEAQGLRFTWMSNLRLPRGVILNFQLDQPGGDFYMDAKAGVTVLNMVSCPSFLVNLGAPAAADPHFFLPPGFVEGAGVIPPLSAKPDVPRNVVIHGANARGACTFRIEGEDCYGRGMAEDIALLGGGVAEGRKAFAKVARIRPGGPCEGEVSIGAGERLGLPVFLPAPGFCLRALADGVEITGGELIPGETAFPSPTAGDRRGTYAPPPELVLDGTRALHLLLTLPNPGNIGAPDFV